MASLPPIDAPSPLASTAGPPIAGPGSAGPSSARVPTAASSPFGMLDEPSYGSAPTPPPAHPPTPPMRPPTASSPGYSEAAPTGAEIVRQSAPPRPVSPSAPDYPRYQSQPPRAPVFTPSMPPPVLIDVTPRALVVETVGGFCDTVIPRNAKIPCERTRAFATAHDHQTTVCVRVAQGEETHFGANTYLGEVELSGLRSAPRGEVSVAVTFELDADGTLRVRAADPVTGRQAAALLQLVGAARESQIMQMTRRIADQPLGPHHNG
jgi:molecular chaperone DnaK